MNIRDFIIERYISEKANEMFEVIWHNIDVEIKKKYNSSYKTERTKKLLDMRKELRNISKEEFLNLDLSVSNKKGYRYFYNDGVKRTE